MRDEKRTFHTEDTEKKPPRYRPQAPRQKITITSTHLMEDRTELAFSRELVMRLINWVNVSTSNVSTSNVSTYYVSTLGCEHIYRKAMEFTVQAGNNFVNTRPLKPDSADLELLRSVFGQRLKYNTPLARYTAAQIGGPAMALLEVETVDELAVAVRTLWQMHVPWFILGGGSNILVSDRGVQGVVLLNRARRVEFNEHLQPPSVWAESGANFGLIARQAAARGLSGLEWAAGIPGTIGGAVVGNAGAHGGDMAGNLLVADILQQSSRSEDVQVVRWSATKFEYGYRTSLLKRQPGKAVVLAALLALEQSTTAEVQVKMDAFVAYRHRTQPPGASMGSMFINPSGDFAGRLLEEAGLKGMRIGNAQISSLHANFFVNQGQASAGDVFALIQVAKKKVFEKFGVELELEIELVGDWNH